MEVAPAAARKCEVVEARRPRPGAPIRSARYRSFPHSVASLTFYGHASSTPRPTVTPPTLIRYAAAKRLRDLARMARDVASRRTNRGTSNYIGQRDLSS